MPDDLRQPYRIQFDNARDPYTARNALGITAAALGAVPTTRTITAGAGLTGGGDLSANRTFDVGAGTGITVNANDVALTVPVSVANGGTGSTTAGAGIITQVVIQKFTASGTYTPTSGMKYCIVECVGGGGGGGGAAGSASNHYVAGGGGSGAYSRSRLTAAAIGASKTVTIGAGGNGGTAGANNGSNGNDTSLGTLCVAKGGSGGGYSSVANNGVGGNGGDGSAGTGDVIAHGSPGGGGFYNAVNATIATRAGGGGSSFFGGGAPAGTGAGLAGGNYGGGGGGATVAAASNVAGGNGSAGIVVITEFI